MGCMTKNHCHVMARVMRIFLNWLKKHKWSCYSSFTSLNTFTKQQGCKEPCKIKDNVTIFGIFKIFL